MAETPLIRKGVIHLLNVPKINSQTNEYAKYEYGTTANYKLINEGVTELTESFNPDTEDIQYVAEKDASTILKKYKPSISLTSLIVSKDEVNKFIRHCCNTLPVGASADIDYIRFCVLDAASDGEKDASKDLKGTYTAYRRKAQLVVDSIGGSAGDTVSTSVTLNGMGDQTKGTILVSGTGSSVTFTWTADSTTTGGTP